MTRTSTFRPSVIRTALFASAMMALTACGTASNAQTEKPDTAAALKAAGLDAKDRAAMEAVVREYILENPEIITEAVQILRQRQTAERLGTVRGEIETPYESAWAGNPNGDVTIVEFSDYACGFCAQSVSDVSQLLAQDKNVKVVFRELPILSEDSARAAAWSLAAAKQGKFYIFHKALFAAGKPNAATIETAAQSAGLDMAAARTFANGPQVRQLLEKNLQIAQQLEFSGTPSWVIGDRTYNGALGLAGLKDAVATARAAKAKK